MLSTLWIPCWRSLPRHSTVFSNPKTSSARFRIFRLIWYSLWRGDLAGPASRPSFSRVSSLRLSRQIDSHCCTRLVRAKPSLAYISLSSVRFPRWTIESQNSFSRSKLRSSWCLGCERRWTARLINSSLEKVPQFTSWLK
jgi:hypothetical protein